MEEYTIRDAETIWDYMLLHQPLADADCMIVLGSRDDRVAHYAAQLLTQYHFDHVILTGGSAHHNDLLATSWAETTEAEHFEAIMRDAGCRRQLFLEKDALNTGDNARLSYELLSEKGLTPVESILIVTKPYMERRALATFDIQWPSSATKRSVTSPPFSFREYVSDSQPLHDVVAIMVGDMQRIIDYPEKNLQSVQEISQNVHHAYMRLVDAGFTQHML